MHSCGVNDCSLRFQTKYGLNKKRMKQRGPNKISPESSLVDTSLVNPDRPNPRLRSFRRVSFTGLALTGGSGALFIAELWPVAVPLGLAGLWVCWRHGRPMDEL